MKDAWAHEKRLIEIRRQVGLAVMREHPLGRNAAIIGEVVADHTGMVIMKSLVGGERVVTLLSGEQLPRIC